MEFDRSDHIVFREADHFAVRENLDLPLRNFRCDALLRVAAA